MRRKMLGGLVAAALSVVLVVGGSARPARAAVDWGTVVVAVASSLFSSGGGGGGDLEQAKREIIAAVNSAKQEILDHIDGIAAADVRACVEAATIKVEQIDVMDPFSLALFVNGAVDCATLSSAYFDAVQSLEAADRIGRLLGEIYAIAMVGFAKVGLLTVDLLDSLIDSYESVVTKLKPECTERRIVENDINGRPLIIEIHYTCVAYNGDRAEGVETYYRGVLVGPRLDRPTIDARATRNTSRAVAQAALPSLRQLRATLP